MWKALKNFTIKAKNTNSNIPENFTLLTNDLQIEKLVKNVEEFEIKYTEWLEIREKTIKLIKEKYEKIEEVNHKSKIIRGVGTGTSITGGLLFFTGLILTSTGIGSVAGVPLMITGTGTSVSGGLTNTISSIVNKKSQEKQTKEAIEIIKFDQKLTEDLLQLLNDIENDVKNLCVIYSKMKDQLICEYQLDDICFDIGLMISSSGLFVKEAFTTSFNLGSGAMRFLGPALVGVTFAFDIIEICGIYKEPDSPESAQKLKIFNEKLQEQKDSLVKFYDE